MEGFANACTLLGNKGLQSLSSLLVRSQNPKPPYSLVKEASTETWHLGH